MASQQPQTFLDRLKLWRDVGRSADGLSPDYSAGSQQFATDVIALLSFAESAAAGQEENEGAFKVWRRRTLAAEAERDAALKRVEEAERAVLPWIEDVGRLNKEIDADDLKIDRLRNALTRARQRIADERHALVEGDTIPGSDGSRDESQMRDLTKAAVAEIDDDLAEIDAALKSTADLYEHRPDLAYKARIRDKKKKRP